MGEAIENTRQLYPGLLEDRPNLHFMLKCRQFIEMVNGCDVEPPNRHVGHTSVIQSTELFRQVKHAVIGWGRTGRVIAIFVVVIVQC